MNKLGYLILYVPDVATTTAFYEQAFGLRRRFVHDSGQYAELETGPTALAFVAEALADTHGTNYLPTRPSARPPAVEVGLVSDDVPAAFRAAVEAGCAPVHAPEVKPWGQTVAYVRDPNGFLVELCSPMSA